MKKMRLMLIMLIAFIAFTATNTFAQDVAGKWEGSIIFSGNYPPGDNWTYDWDFNKWLNVNRAPWKFSLELKVIKGDKYTGKYMIGTNGGDCTIRFDAVFDGNELKGNTEGSAIKGVGCKLAGYVELTLREEEGKRYLEGIYRANANAKMVGGKVALRQTDGGGGGGGNANANPPKGDFANVETGEEYNIKLGDHFLYLNDDGTGIISKKDGEEEARKWKFEAAPDGYGKAFRIIPVKKDDLCLEPVSDDSGKIRLVAKEDKAEGEQYWRFERTGDGVQIVNVKFGGRSLIIEDEDSGLTIIRSRNDAQSSKWLLVKQ